MSHDLQPYLEFATDAAWQAGRLTLQYFQAAFNVEWKKDATPVTVADRGAERLLRELITARFPDHAVVGEEYGADHRQDARFRWIIDPIDGTKSFIHGVPLYAVLMGLEIDGELVVGVANFPGLNEMVCAARGSGCWWNGRRCRVSEVDRLEESVVCYTSASGFGAAGKADRWARIAGRVKMQRGWGDAYGHVLVATGRVEAMFDPVMSLWDCAALVPILNEAGGTFTDWQGKPTAYGNEAISTNNRVFAEIMAELSAGAA
jgi:histidinol phosphatase-like enzyme (inositol monophosphatase family)